jgi:hypothetical protein
MKMKNLIIFFSLLVITSFTSCQEEVQWINPPVKATPVYLISDIQQSAGLFQVEIYKEIPLMIEFLTATSSQKFTITNYVDNSTAVDFNISFTKLIKTITKTGETTTEVQYTITAPKSTGVGTVSFDGQSYTATLSSAMRYN